MSRSKIGSLIILFSALSAWVESSLAVASNASNLPRQVRGKVRECTDLESKNLKSVVFDYLSNKRSDLKALGVLPSSPEFQVLLRATPVPCLPKVDISQPRTLWPGNVQNIDLILGQEKWNQFVLPFDKIGLAKGSGDQPYPEYPADYLTFLTVAARFPYFCADQGVYSSEIEACGRELATFFAHATQETGSGDTSIPFSSVAAHTRIGSILTYTRELGGSPDSPCQAKGQSHPNESTCTKYDGGAPSSAPSVDGKLSVHYYGRGIKQITWWYNYAGFGFGIIGDQNVFIENPDEVAMYGYYLLGTGIWFTMTPQNPKPSMHDVVVGRYATSNGSPEVHYLPSGEYTNDPSYPAVPVNVIVGDHLSDPFEATVSIMNGAYECYPSVDYFLSADSTGGLLVKSQSRYYNYTQILSQLGVNMNAAEQLYNTVDGIYHQSCGLPSGAIFGATDLWTAPKLMLNPGANCSLVSWDTGGMALNIAVNPDALAYCRSLNK
jgi:Chitinase class I